MFIRSIGGWRLMRPLREADKDSGGSSITLAEQAAAIRAKVGDDVAQYALMVAERNREGQQYRQRIKDIEGRIPGEGTVVLDAATAALWQAYQGLGTPEELKQFLQEREALATENGTFKREKTIAQVAKAAGYKADVLTEVGGAAEYVVKTVDEAGKQVERAFVKQGDQEIPIDQHFAKLLPALKEQPTNPGAGLGSPVRTATTPAQPANPGAATRSTVRF